MSNHNDGGAAYPRPGSDWMSGPGERKYQGGQRGMSLRDYFAEQALPAVIRMRIALKVENPLGAVDAVCNGVGAAIEGHQDVDGSPLTFAKDVAGDAYCIADAMLAAREVKP